MNLAFWIIFFVLLIVLLATMGYKKESVESFTSLNDYANVTRDQYIQLGKHRFNRLADPIDVFRPGITRRFDEAGIRQLNEKVRTAIVTSEVINNKNNFTNTTISQTTVKDKFPLENNILKEAKKCEAVTTRQACSILGNPEYAKCGVCIKGGTDTMENKKGSFIGGMLLLPVDKDMAEAEASGTGSAPKYYPTTGTCPEGFMFVNKVACEKEVNRQNCLEAGEAGGFSAGEDGGKTVEGATVIPTSCAACPINGKYIYEPKTRRFQLALRVITPNGTGMNVVTIRTVDRNTRQEVEIANQRAVGGTEMYFRLSALVEEGQELKCRVFQEIPHRSAKNNNFNEVFYVDKGWYGYTKNDASGICQTFDAEMATKAQMEDAQESNAQLCYWGWLKDGGIAFPMQADSMRGNLGSSSQDSTNWCGTGNGLRYEPSTAINANRKAGVWCYGVKPPPGYYADPNTGSFAWGIAKQVFHWFRSEGDKSKPSQEDRADEKSKYGADFEVETTRGVILQWETPPGTQTMRRMAVEGSIVTVNGQSASTLTTDGVSISRILRRKGMFSSNSATAMISAPNTTTHNRILQNAYWIWSNQNTNPVFEFVARVPGVFLDTFYPEDQTRCPSGPLAGKKETLDLLKVSPCERPGQTPGNYSLDCKKFLFVGAGGDIYNGTGNPVTGNMSSVLTENGLSISHEEILEKLNAMNDVAKSGRIRGQPTMTPAQRRTVINQYAMFLFGKELVTPCEDIEESASGSFVIRPKSGPFAVDCLDYLFLNAGTSKSRNMEESSRNTSIKATYVTIGERYSGIRSDETASPEERSQFPFQTCKRSGSAAPVGTDGQPKNAAISAANAAAAARTNSLLDVQNYFNNIFQTANRRIDTEGTPDAITIRTQEDAIRKCFGITKVMEPRSTSGCGLVARYIRIIRSLSGNAETHISNSNEVRQFGAQIRLSQVEVFNDLNEEIAKGKLVIAANASSGTLAENANNGNTNVRDTQIYADSDGANDLTNFWRVDLGEISEVRKVKVYVTSNFKFKMWDAVAQLLDADQKVIAHKVLRPDMLDIRENPNNSIATFVFSKEDITMPTQIGEIKPGLVMNLESGVMTEEALGGDHFNHGTYNTVFRSLTGTNADRKDMELTVRGAISGLSGAISILYKNQFHLFVNPQNNTHGHNRCYYLDLSQTQDEVYKKAASWVVRPALSGEPGWFSLQNVQYPNMYLAVYPQGGKLSLVMGSPRLTNNFIYDMLTCWRAHKISTTDT